MMPKFKLEGEIYTFDYIAYNQALFNYLEEQMKLAAQEFAKAALSNIPVRTGFAAGAFGNLEQLLDMSVARLNPVVAAHREYYYGTLKTPTTGRQFATPAADIFTKTPSTITFNYDINIVYFKMYEERGVWHAFDSGEKAFMDYMEQNLLRGVPRAEQFMRKQSIKVG